MLPLYIALYTPTDVHLCNCACPTPPTPCVAVCPTPPTPCVAVCPTPPTPCVAVCPTPSTPCAAVCPTPPTRCGYIHTMYRTHPILISVSGLSLGHSSTSLYQGGGGGGGENRRHTEMRVLSDGLQHTIQQYSRVSWNLQLALHTPWHWVGLLRHTGWQLAA